MINVRNTAYALLGALLTGACAAPVVESQPAPETISVFPESPLRPPVIGSNAGVSAGHPLTTSAAVEILQQGGNAFDAGVAALLVGGVVEQDLYGIGGEALILVYPAAEAEVVSVTGQGWAPGAASIDDYLREGRTLQGQGLDPSVIRIAWRAYRAGTMGDDELRAGCAARNRVRPGGLSVTFPNYKFDTA